MGWKRHVSPTRANYRRLMSVRPSYPPNRKKDATDHAAQEAAGPEEELECSDFPVGGDDDNGGCDDTGSDSNGAKAGVGAGSSGSSSSSLRGARDTRGTIDKAAFKAVGAAAAEQATGDQGPAWKRRRTMPSARGEIAARAAAQEAAAVAEAAADERATGDQSQQLGGQRQQEKPSRGTKRGNNEVGCFTGHYCRVGCSLPKPSLCRPNPAMVAVATAGRG